MYVIVTYDLPIVERGASYQLLNQRLNHLQNSVFAGELTRQEAQELFHDLKDIMTDGSCLVWIFDRRVDPILIGQQEDLEDNFF